MKHVVTFERKDWNPELVTIRSPENTVWTIKIIHNSGNDGFKDRYIQRQILKELKENFSSIIFLGAASLYFYFSDAADEAFFIMQYNGEETSVED